MLFYQRLAGWALTLLAAIALATDGVVPSSSEQFEDLGDGRYRVGNIEVDRNASSFVLSGRVIEQDSVDAPMEFLAVTEGGFKSYEAVFELDTTATDFNLACILIGLDSEQARRPRYHFDPEETLGQPVVITVGFDSGETYRKVKIENFLLAHEESGPHEWVYTGSGFSGDGRYLAETYGTLIGFVHDPESIIQHRRGLGLGDYGAVVYDPDLVPPPGSAIRVTVSRR